MKRIATMTFTLLLIPAILHAAASDDERGWSFSQRFQGNSNAAGIVLKTNSTVAYSFNRFFQAYAGLPMYIVRQSGSTQTNPNVMTGIGNVFAGFLISADKSSLNYSSDLVLTAPTGDQTRGFSTGHATVDWTNTISRPLSSITPYGSIGAGNTISDTSFFVRPFTTNGAVVHFEGGALVKLAPRVSIGASAYGLRAAGQQQVISKLVEKQISQPSSNSSPSKQGNGIVSAITHAAGLGKGNGNDKTTVFETTHETVTTADFVNDHGVSTWLSIKPGLNTDFQIGYSHSAAYQLDSLFFGVGFRVGR